MGNQILCCKQKWRKLDESDEKFWLDDYDVFLSYQYQNVATTGCPLTSTDGLQHQYGQMNPVESTESAHKVKVTTQHISEREPDEFDIDPSINACRSAIFSANAYTGNSLSGAKLSRGLRPNRHVSMIPTRWSSCSTVYIGSGCIFHPDKEATIRSVAVAINLLLHYQKKHAAVEHIFNDCEMRKPPFGVRTSDDDKIYKDVYLPFDERKYSITCHFLAPDSEGNTEVDRIYEFIKILFRTTLFGPECAIVALILLERLVISAEVDIFHWSWRRQVLACVLLASKVLDDQAVWNMDYCNILHGTSVDDLNALERHLLALLQFNIHVPMPVYARYFFDLLTLGDTGSGLSGEPGTRRRLTPELAAQLQLIPAHHVNTTVSGAGRHSSDGVEHTAHSVFDLPFPLKRSPLRRNSLPTLHLSTEPVMSSRQSSVIANLPGRWQNLSPASYPDRGTHLTGKSAVTSASYREAPTPRLRLQTPSGDTMQRLNSQPSLLTPPEDSYICYDPLVVDDETALINSCGHSPPAAACADGKYRSSRFTPKSLNPHYHFYQMYYNSGSGVLPHTAGAYPQWQATGSEANRGRETATVMTSRPTEVTFPMNQVIRTVMGGGRTVTYSLLRDAGLF